MANLNTIAIIVPVMNRPQNAALFMQSLAGAAKVYAVAEPTDIATIQAWQEAGATVLDASGPSFAVKVNDAYRLTTEPWLFIVGDDVCFHPGWLEAAFKYADKFKVIGTNDLCTTRVKLGVHATHFFIDRDYIDAVGASWDGPGIVCHEGYRHWFVDDEIINAAKQRGVWIAATDSVVEHLHPVAKKAQTDPVYNLGAKYAKQDEALFTQRFKGNGGVTKDPFGDAIENLTPNIFIAQPRRDASLPLLQNLPQVEGLAWPYGATIRYGSTEGLDTVEARNALINKALEDNAEYVWFVDDDTVIPFQGLAQLFYAARLNDYPVIGGVVPLKQDPPLPVTICVKDNRLYYPDLSYADQIVPCNWVTGFACLLINTDVFRQMRESDPDMPFVWPTATAGETPIGEDGWFCHRCHRLNIPIMIHRAVQCRHYNLQTRQYWGGHESLEYYLEETDAC